MNPDYLTAIKSSLGSITRSRDEIDLCSAIAEALIDHFGFTRVTLRKVNTDDSLTLLRDLGFMNRSVGGPQTSDDPSSINGGSMALSEEEELLTAKRLLPEFSGLNTVMISSPYALAPIKVRDKTTMVLGVAKKRDRGIITPHEKEVLGLFCEIAGVTSENIISKEVLVRDELTELYNRHYFMKRLNEEFDRARRYDVPLSCCLFDIDDFKLINDTYGHIFGDKVLRQIAGLTKDIVRGTDIVARYGGEEFIILFTHTRQEHALIAVEQISHTISSLTFRQDEKEARVTATFGLATFRQDSTSEPSTLLHHADMALYEGKRQYQKNAVVVYADKGFRILKRDESLARKIRNMRNTLERLSQGGVDFEGSIPLERPHTNAPIANPTPEGRDNQSRNLAMAFLSGYLSRGSNVAFYVRAGLVIVLVLLLLMSSFGDGERVGDDSSPLSGVDFAQFPGDLSCKLNPSTATSFDEIVYRELLIAGRSETNIKEKIEKKEKRKIARRARNVNPRLEISSRDQLRAGARVRPIEWQLKNAFLLSEL